MRGLLELTWLEIRIFVREPLGFVGAIVIPLAMFLLLGRSLSPSADHSPRASQFLAQDLPLFVSIFISINAALSLVAVISIYREGGILKRLRATPLRPAVILGAHVLVKLLFTGSRSCSWSSRAGASTRCRFTRMWRASRSRSS